MTSQQLVAIGIFVATFALILTERVHRTIVAMVGALVMLVAGLLMGFYSQALALAAIDFNTLGLLLGMMILVRLLEQTGFFEYIAIVTGKRSGGRPWVLLIVLGAATTVLSMFLDNVTTVVLIVPVTILIAQVLGINPVPLLVSEAVLSNIGGVATLVGDPPNVLIGSAAGLTFDAFLLRMAPLALVAWFVALPILFLPSGASFGSNRKISPRWLSWTRSRRSTIQPTCARYSRFLAGSFFCSSHKAP